MALVVALAGTALQEVLETLHLLPPHKEAMAGIDQAPEDHLWVEEEEERAGQAQTEEFHLPLVMAVLHKPLQLQALQFITLVEVVVEVPVDQAVVLAATQPQLHKKVGQEMGRHLAQGRGAQVAQIQAVVLVAVVLLLVEFVVLEQRAALAS